MGIQIVCQQPFEIAGSSASFAHFVAPKRQAEKRAGEGRGGGFTGLSEFRFHDLGQRDTWPQQVDTKTSRSVVVLIA